MLFFLLSYLAGALTLFAPCILPVLPFVFARVDLANDYGRIMGVALVAPRWADRLGRPLVALGARLSGAATSGPGAARRPALASFVLGAATGLLWAPCAGPILGLVLTGAAIEGPSLRTALLLLAYAGAASALALVLLAGARMLGAVKRLASIGEGFRRGLGVAVLAAVAAVALGLDTGWLAQLSPAGGAAIEKTLLQRLKAPTPLAAGFMPVQARAAAPVPLDLPVEGSLPSADRRRRLAQLATAVHRRAARQGGAGRLLDLRLHQLPQCAALRERMASQVTRTRAWSCSACMRLNSPTRRISAT